jgi:hypothetical protein
MMVGEKHPLDPLNADFRQVLKHTPITQINQQRRVPISQDIHVASVRPGKHLRKTVSPKIRPALGGRGSDRTE